MASQLEDIRTIKKCFLYTLTGLLPMEKNRQNYENFFNVCNHTRRFEINKPP